LCCNFNPTIVKESIVCEEKKVKVIKKILEEIMKVEVVIAACMIISMVAIMVLEVVMRYIFNNSIIWVQEFAILLFIWITMLGASASSMSRGHITITTFSQFISGRWKNILEILISLIIFGVLIYLLLTLPRSIIIQNKTATSSMPINIGKGNYYSTPLFLAVILMFITEVYYFYYEILTLLGKPIPDDYMLVLNLFSKNKKSKGEVSV
jgi:TRAP-type C4-dicarboxylate transport system permease small subunit